MVMLEGGYGMVPSGETNSWITGREDTMLLTDLVKVGGGEQES